MIKKDWTGNNKITFVQLGASSHSTKERETNDFYATDPNALNIFLKKLNEDNIKLHNDIWECACGAGHLSKVLKNNNYNVKSTDLVNRGYGDSNVDFLKVKDTNVKKDILTNPPYKFAQQFVEKALNIIDDGYYVIMFLKIQFLEGKTRQKLYKQKNLKYVYVNSARQLCAMNGEFDKYNATALCYCWFIWQKGYNGEPTIRWL